MQESPIKFFSEDISYVLRNKTQLRSWLVKCALKKKKKINSLNYIFCSDPFLKKMNKQYLNHDYLTDIITFPTSEPSDKNINGDIYISIDRIKDNAFQYGVSITDELHRVMVHGLLHLCGYGDKSDREKSVMRKQEDESLKARGWRN